METFVALATRFSVTPPSATRRLKNASLPTLRLRLSSKGLIIASIAATLALACPAFNAGAATPDPPGTDAIGETLGAAMPGYWTVQRLELKRAAFAVA